MEIKKIKPTTEYAWVIPGMGYYRRGRVSKVRTQEKILLGYRAANGLWQGTPTRNPHTGVEDRKLFTKVEIFDGVEWEECFKAVPTRQLTPLTPQIEQLLVQQYDQRIKQQQYEESREAREAKINELLRKLLDVGIVTNEAVVEALHDIDAHQPIDAATAIAADWLEAIVNKTC